MSKKIIIISLFLAVVTLVVFFAVKWTFKETEKTVAAEKPVAETDVSSLLQLFQSREDSANQLYLGKVISVTGIVDSFDEDSTSISVYLKNADDFSGVMCIFDKTTISIASFQAGREITIKGVCSGYLFDVVLNKCAFSE